MSRYSKKIVKSKYYQNIEIKKPTLKVGFLVYLL
jgi:hypothetical protein